MTRRGRRVHGLYLIARPRRVGLHFSYQHGIAIFGGTYAIGAVAVLIARLCFFKRDKVS